MPPDSYKQAASSRPNPFPSRPPHPPRRATPPISTTRRNFRFFRGQPSQPSPPPHFFLSSPTDTSRVDPFDVIIPFTLGVYIFPTPDIAFPLRETTTGPTSWFFTGRRGKGGRIYCFIFLNGFRRIDLRRLHVPSWSRADVTHRQDHFRRVSFRRKPHDPVHRHHRYSDIFPSTDRILVWEMVVTVTSSRETRIKVRYIFPGRMRYVCIFDFLFNFLYFLYFRERLMSYLSRVFIGNSSVPKRYE